MDTMAILPLRLHRSPQEATLFSQALMGMYGSDAMALIKVVGIPDLVQTYIEPMETARLNGHASGWTQWPYCLCSHTEAPRRPLYSQPLNGMYGSDAMALVLGQGSGHS